MLKLRFQLVGMAARTRAEAFAGRHRAIKGSLGRWIVALLLAMASCAAQEKIVVMGSTEYPPFYGKDLPNGGAMPEIAEEAFKKVGYRVEFRFRPFARVLREAKNGELDGVVVLWRSLEREHWFLFSDSLPSNQVGFFGREDDVFDWRVRSELVRRRIGVVRGYALPRDFDTAGLKLEEATDDEQNLRKLVNGRVDLVLIDRDVAKRLIAKRFAENAGELVWIDPPVERRAQYVAFSRVRRDAGTLVREFNEGLRRIESEGRVKAILAKHGIRP